MFGLEPVGPGRDVRVEGAGVPEFETPLGAPAAELAATDWKRQVLDPQSEAIDGAASGVSYLEGVRGFCSAVQAQNINSEWSFGAARRRLLPFTTPVGESKGARIDTARNGIVFDEPGKWTIHALIHARQTDAPNGAFEYDASALILDICKPDGSVWKSRIVDVAGGKPMHSINCTFTTTIPAPGYFVTVTAFSTRWRWWDGGDRYTELTVHKHDHRITNPGVGTVPDEPPPTT